MPYAVTPFPVYSRLVGNDHSCLERHRVEVLAYILRTFVHSEEKAYAVAGAVAEVALALP